MVILRDLSIYWGMFHVIFVFIMLFRSKYSRKKTLLIAGSAIGVIMLLNAVGLILFGIDVLSKIFLITCSVPSFVLFYVLSEDKRFRFLFTFCMADTICLWIMAATNLLDFYLGGGKFVVMFISRLAAFPFIEYTVYRYLRKPYLELQGAVEKGWGVFAGMTVLYYILLVVMVQYPTNIVNRPEDVFSCILVLMLMFFNYGTIFSALYRQLQLYRKQQSERILKQQKNALEAQLETQQRIQKMKQDMKEHAAALSEMLLDGETEEAVKYLERLQTEMDTLSRQFCANPYINAVFIHYYQKLQELEAECNLDIEIGDEELPYMDLCQILSNGLENACDALKNFETYKRKISIQIKYRNNYLNIRLENCCKENFLVEKGTIPTTGKEGTGHGFGLLTIQEAAERLGGEMFCYTENGSFVLDVKVDVR